MSFTETDLGFIKEQDGYLIFFGKNSASLDQIKTAYPDIHFRTIHQKHTDVCILSHASTQDEIADAHYTTEVGVGLIVKTADCLPIMAYSQKQNLIVAIHAGWRGVENQITLKSLTTAQMQAAEIFIGPHILQKNFEIDLDVKDQLEKTYLLHATKPNPSTFTARENKFFINLIDIVEEQVKSASIPFHIHKLLLDTVSDSRLHSYRRDKQNSGRNLSFIARLKS